MIKQLLVHIDERLHRQVKAKAASLDLKLKDVVTCALEAWLAKVAARSVDTELLEELLQSE